MTTRTHHRRNSPLYEERRNSRNELYYKPYTLGRPLGKGGFAHVYEAHIAEDNTAVALKIIGKSDRSGKVDPQYCQKIRREIQLMEMASKSSPNVVKYLHSFSDKDNFYILMELCSLGSLNDIVKRRRLLSEPEARYYARQMALTLAELRKQNIIHRDIKLANFFVTSDQQLRLGDFGLATLDNQEFRSKRSLCGTPNYIAPEVVEKKDYSFPVDAWALGVSVFTLLLGVPPFETKTCKDTYQRIKKCSYKFEGPYRHSRLSEESKSFIQEILVYDPQQRLTPEQMLVHPFLTHYPVPLCLEPQWALSAPPHHFVKKFSSPLGKKAGSQNETILEKKRRRPGPLYRLAGEEADVPVKEEQMKVKVEPVPCKQEGQTKMEAKVKEEHLKEETSKLQTSVSLLKRDAPEGEPMKATVKKRFRSNRAMMMMREQDDLELTPTMVKSELEFELDACSLGLLPDHNQLLHLINHRRTPLKFKHKSRSKEKKKEEKLDKELFPSKTTNKVELKIQDCHFDQPTQKQLGKHQQGPIPDFSDSPTQPLSREDYRHLKETTFVAFAQSPFLALYCFKNGNFQLTFPSRTTILVSPEQQKLVCLREGLKKSFDLPIGQASTPGADKSLNLSKELSALKDFMDWCPTANWDGVQKAGRQGPIEWGGVKEGVLG